MRRNFVICWAGLVWAGSLALAAAADIEHGRQLFESPALGGGTTGKSCKTCHAGGARLSKNFADQKSYMIMGMEKQTLAEVVNVCIEKPLGGKAIDPQGQDMADLIAYLQTLK